MIPVIRRPKAILFDLDDTISSFDSVCAPAWEKCCEEFVKKHQTSFTVVDLLDSIGKTNSWYWSDPVRHKNGRENLKEARREVVLYSLETLGVTNKDLAMELADHYSETQNSMLSLLPHAKEALEAVKAFGIRMAVVTNGASEVQREKLERFGITGFFDKLVIDSEVGFSKPDKEIFKYAVSQLKLSPEEVWMVGDNLIWDVWGAEQLGIYAVWNDYKGKGLPVDSKVVPDLIVNSIYEMAKIISSI